MSLEQIIEKIAADLADKERRQDAALQMNREIIRECAKGIKLLHMNDFEGAKKIAAALDSRISEMKAVDAGLEHISSSALQEYAEIRCLLALLEKKDLPAHDELGMDYVSYLSGLADCTGELRRAFQLALRRGDKAEAEYLFDKMNYIYDNLMTLKFSASLVGPLKRKQDVLRGQIEQARSELLRSA